MTIQQGGQTVYPTHVQYVDGSDPGIYANGQMYEIYIIRCASVCCGLHTGLSGSNAWLLCTNILNIVSAWQCSSQRKWGVGGGG